MYFSISLCTIMMTILHNFYASIISISLIFILPVLLSIKLWQKALWILSNYICFLTCIIVSEIVLTEIDSTDSLLGKISIGTPNSEYRNFYLKRSFSESMIEDEYLLLLLRKPNNGKAKFVRTQFVTRQLFQSFKMTNANQTRKRIKNIDSLRRNTDTTRISKTWIDSLTFYPRSRELTLAKLDSIKREVESGMRFRTSLRKRSR